MNNELILTSDEKSLFNIFLLLKKYEKINDYGDCGEDVYKFENISDDDYFSILNNMKAMDLYIDYSPDSDGLYYDDSHEIGLYDQCSSNVEDPDDYNQRVKEYFNLCMGIFKNGGRKNKNNVCISYYFIRLRHSTDGGDYCSSLDNTYIDFNKGFYDLYSVIFGDLK